MKERKDELRKGGGETKERMGEREREREREKDTHTHTGTASGLHVRWQLGNWFSLELLLFHCDTSDKTSKPGPEANSIALPKL